MSDMTDSDVAEQEADYIDGHPITNRAIKLTKAGDGLSEALKIENHRLNVGDKVTVIVKGVVGGPTHKPRDAGEYDGDYVRVDNIVAESATIVESKAVDNIMGKHEKRVLELRMQEKERREGLKRIPFDDTTDDEDQAEEDGVTPDNVTSIVDDGS